MYELIALISVVAVVGLYAKDESENGAKVSGDDNTPLPPAPPKEKPAAHFSKVSHETPFNYLNDY